MPRGTQRGEARAGIRLSNAIGEMTEPALQMRSNRFGCAHDRRLAYADPGERNLRHRGPQFHSDKFDSPCLWALEERPPQRPEAEPLASPPRLPTSAALDETPTRRFRIQLCPMHLRPLMTRFHTARSSQ